MKRLLFIIFTISIGFSIIGCATTGIYTNRKAEREEKKVDSNKSCKEGECLKFYYKKKFVGAMTKKQFSEMIKSTKIFNTIKDSEEKKRVSVELNENPWKITVGEKYITTLSVIWRDDKKKIIKVIKIEGKFTVPKEANMSKIRERYRDISEIGFPLTFLGLIVLLIFI